MKKSFFAVGTIFLNFADVLQPRLRHSQFLGILSQLISSTYEVFHHCSSKAVSKKCRLCFEETLVLRLKKVKTSEPTAVVEFTGAAAI